MPCLQAVSPQKKMVRHRQRIDSDSSSDTLPLDATVELAAGNRDDLSTPDVIALDWKVDDFMFDPFFFRLNA